MGTSGTVATTTIDTASVIEHAFRRCKILPNAQTPETVLIAKECLYMLLLNVGNRGLNLWCVERAFLSVSSGVKTYTTAPGTLDVLNVVYSKPTLVAGAFAATATGGVTVLSVASPVVRVGVKFASGYTGALTLSTSTDGLVFEANTSVPSATYVAGQYYWFALNSVSTNLSIAVDGPVAAYPALSDIIVASAVYDLPLTQWNRDTYAAINAKDQSGSPSTSYFYEKKLTPTITLWPVPNNSTDHLTLYQHRQPQDVGSLTQQIEIPQRWLDGFIWLLAARLCFELPAIDPQVVTNVLGMAEKQELEMEQTETDGATTYLTPNIRGYTS